MTEIGEETFDLAGSYIRLVELPDINKAVQEAFRVLRPNGRFVVVNLHPMISGGKGWLKPGDEKLHFPGDNYFDESARGMPLKEREITGFHQTLSTYVNTFISTGFVLEGIRESMPSEKQVAQFPEITDNLRVPDFIIYLLREPGDNAAEC